MFRISQVAPSHNLKPALALWLVAIAAAALLPACGVRQIMRGEIQPPQVTLQNVNFGLPSGDSWPLSLTLLLHNPNSQNLTVLGYDYDLWLEGKSVAQGASNQSVTLPAGGQVVMEFPVAVKLPAVLGLAPLFLRQNQRLHYQIAGGFRLASLLGGFRVPFRFNGEVTPREGMDFLKPYLGEGLKGGASKKSLFDSPLNPPGENTPFL